MKPRTPRRRKPPPRDAMPPDVPEAAANASPIEPGGERDPEEIPDHIRRMLEAAYT